MPTSTQIASYDSETNASKTTTNYASSKTAILQSSPVHNFFLYFANPIPAGATVISATLTLAQKGVAAGGSRTFTAQRAATAWTESKLTHANQPAGVGSTATAVLGDGGTDGRAWAFNVQPLMSEVSAGGVWFGFKITSSNSTALSVFTKNNATLQPTLALTWSTGPSQPTELHPSNGRAISGARPLLKFGSSTAAAQIASYQVQINTSDVWTSPATDTGQVFSPLAQHLVTADVTVNVLQYWRVRVWDAAGVVSPWSPTASFIRKTQSTLAITLPAVSPNNFVNDATPPIAWTFSGTQTKFQVLITDPLNAATIYHDSSVIASTSLTYTLPEGVLNLAGTYRLTVRAWDNIDRESISGDNAWVEAFRDFTFQLSATVAAVTSFVATARPYTPYVDVTWTSSTAPDSFRFISDGLAVGVAISAANAFVSGTSYAYTLTNLPPRRAHALTVARVVNNVVSSSNPTQNVTTTPEGVWLSALDGSNPVCVLTDDSTGDWATAEVSTVFKPVGTDYSVVQTQTLGGRNGNIAGHLVGGQGGFESITADMWLARFNALRDPAAQILRLALTDTVLTVCVRMMLSEPADEDGDIPVSFEFYEQPDA